ncbi:MAG: FeoB-associated Cys-rich membrane protein [bacterium]
MIQYILASILLIWALYYLYKTIKKQFSTNSNCASGCSSCSVGSELNKFENIKS